MSPRVRSLDSSDVYEFYPKEAVKEFVLRRLRLTPSTLGEKAVAACKGSRGARLWLYTRVLGARDGGCIQWF